MGTVKDSMTDATGDLPSCSPERLIGPFALQVFHVCRHADSEKLKSNRALAPLCQQFRGSGGRTSLSISPVLHEELVGLESPDWTHGQ